MLTLPVAFRRSLALALIAFSLIGRTPHAGAASPDTPTPGDALPIPARAVAAGGEHTCALTADGRVFCWGDNHYGQLGDGGPVGLRAEPAPVPGLTGIVALSAGGKHTCALTGDGGVMCWGEDGLTEYPDAEYHVTPVVVPGLETGVTEIAAGDSPFGSHTCALMADGGMKCWGDNAFGQLGDGTTDDRTAPVDVIGLLGPARAITAGSGHSCAVRADGSAACWGYNDSGQLGDGSREERHFPTPVSGLASGVAAISAGSYHTCATLTDGSATCWGSNAGGALGDGSREDRATPVAVSGLAAGSGVATVSGGGGHTCALLTNGGVKCWGGNYHGALGDGSTEDRLVPARVAGLAAGAVQIAAGANHTCAVLAGGRLQCWGDGSYGQLGEGTALWETRPRQVQGLAGPVMALVAGVGHTCALIEDSPQTPGGRMQCWGYNYSGQLGTGDREPSRLPRNVSGLQHGVVRIAAASSHTCALLYDGRVKCWGGNWSGQLGDGSTADRDTPVSVLGLPAGVTAIATGYAQTCAVAAGGAWCWGDNSSGQLGDGTTENRSLPVGVIGLPAGGGVTDIATGGVSGFPITSSWAHTCATLADGAARCWGAGEYGELGDGQATSSLTPVPVSGLAGPAMEIAVGAFHSCARLSGGGLMCWGGNWSGQLGDGTGGPPEPLPVAVGGVTQGVRQVASTRDYNCAVTQDGGALCWGGNDNYQIGDGTDETRFAPVMVTGLPAAVVGVAPGGAFGYHWSVAHACAWLTDGSAYCWGSDLVGQLGDGLPEYQLSPVTVPGFGPHYFQWLPLTYRAG